MLTAKKIDEDKTFNQLIEEDWKYDEKIIFPNDVGYLYVPQTTDEISGGREEKDEEYLQTQLKIQKRDFETIQNIENKERKKLIQSLIDPSGSGLKLNINIAPEDWMTKECDVANKVKFLENIK